MRQTTDLHAELRPLVINGISAQLMDSLSTGAILISFALMLGANNFVVGLIGAMPFLSNLLQAPAVFLVERLRNRKRIMLWTMIGSRAALGSVLLLPWLAEPDTALWLLLGAMFVRYCFGAVATCAWNSWMRDLVPPHRLGEFFARRLGYMTWVAALAGIGTAFLLDWSAQDGPWPLLWVYAGLYGAAFCSGVVSIVYMLRIPEVPMAEAEAEAYGQAFQWRRLQAPFYHANFRRLMAFMCAWNFSVNLATPFFIVYMLTTLGYSLRAVILLTLFSQAVTALSLRVWGRYADRFSHKSVLGFCGTLFLFCFLGWTFVAFPERHAWSTPILVILHLFMGVATAGVSLTTNSIALKLAPSKQATSFLAINSLVSSLAAGIAPLIGGLFADYFAARSLSISVTWQSPEQALTIETLVINHWDFFFILAFIVGLYSLHRLTLVQEEGSLPKRAILRDLMWDAGRMVRSATSVDGLRDIVSTPFSMLTGLVKRQLREDAVEAVVSGRQRGSFGDQSFETDAAVGTAQGPLKPGQ
ncbi:MAG TPA: MFS transporter [Spongiibacteraceae bacterium]|nr:MFS transporter [Spongiibacteraceae bacterium]